MHFSIQQLHQPSHINHKTNCSDIEVSTFDPKNNPFYMSARYEYSTYYAIKNTTQNIAHR